MTDRISAPGMHRGTGAASYALATGAADAARLELLNQHYNPASRALLESVGLAEGHRVADVGCGHGVMTAWIAQRVGVSGLVYALDASAEQLAVATRRLEGFAQARAVCAQVESRPLPEGELDVAYSRFLMLHLPDPAAAVRVMAGMLKPGGRLVVEVADIGTLRFSPGGPDSELWAKWWFALGRARGASYDLIDRFGVILRDAGLDLERMDIFQPVSTRREAKLLHALGFHQLAPDYIDRAGADPSEVERHAAYLETVLDDPTVSVALYRTTHYVACKPDPCAAL